MHGEASLPEQSSDCPHPYRGEQRSIRSAEASACISTFDPTESPSDVYSPLKIVHWNILDGAVERWDLCAVWLDKIRPDVLTLCECNCWDDAEAKRRLAPLGLPHVVFGETQWGYHLCWASREPCVRFDFLTTGFWHGALHIKHPRFEAIHTHLAPGREAERVSIRAHEADVLARRISNVSGPLILTGDLNSLSPLDADCLTDVADTGNLEATAVGHLLTTGLVDLGAGVEPRWSMPTAISGSDAHRRLDYILASPDLAPRCGPARIHQEEPLPRASDHFPVMVELDL